MNAPPAPSTDAYTDRIWCTEWDLAGSGDLPVPDRWRGRPARILVRHTTRVLDFVEIDCAGASVGAAELTDGLSPAGRQRWTAAVEAADTAGSDGPDGPDTDPSTRPMVSVVVCTRNRADELRECLLTLRRLTWSPLEVVVVDNAPDDDSTRRCFRRTVGDDLRFRYVVEPRPGLSRARNRGLAAAVGDIVAYTDDDVRVDPDWATALVGPFRRSEVGAVTGLVCTATLASPAERYFDAKVSWATSCAPAEYHLDTPGMAPLYPYASGLFGTGAAMAFRPEILRRLGGFDEALGAGTRTAGGEDLDIFVQVLLAGHTLVYEPSAVAWHRHRADIDGLRRQMYGYGSGLTAYLTKHLLHRRSRRTLVTRLPRGLVHMAGIARGSQRVATGTELPTRALLLRELAGMAMGPVLYLASRRRAAGPSPAVTEPEPAEVTS